MRIDCLACQNELFVKESDEYALEYSLHLSHLFRSR
jgi:hypothetical protein